MRVPFSQKIIDFLLQSSPTLFDLSLINMKSIVVPLGEVKISRKIESLSIIIRTNSNVNISDQNKKRIFNEDKLKYIERSLNSLVVSINEFKRKNCLDNIGEIIKKHFKAKVRLRSFAINQSSITALDI